VYSVSFKVKYAESSIDLGPTGAEVTEDGSMRTYQRSLVKARNYT
jgi:hypothetical protein